MTRSCAHPNPAHSSTAAPPSRDMLHKGHLPRNTPHNCEKRRPDHAAKHSRARPNTCALTRLSYSGRFLVKSR
eukprot:4803925-Prymnesium_polylepis.1